MKPDGKFSVLIVDAFSSDAIPVHLLTREAFTVYKRVLTADGMLLVHISNKHPNLQPVVAALASDADMIARINEHEPEAAKERSTLDYPADLVAMARRAENPGRIFGDTAWRAVPVRTGYPAWTDDYSNVLSVIKW